MTRHQTLLLQAGLLAISSKQQVAGDGQPMRGFHPWTLHTSTGNLLFTNRARRMPTPFRGGRKSRSPFA